jgi:hypothetical protein
VVPRPDIEDSSIDAFEPLMPSGPQFASLPNPEDRKQYNHWAQEVVDSLQNHNENNLPPILSLIYIPWVKPKYERRLTDEEGNPILSDYGNEPLKDIPWLPRTIPYQTKGWLLTAYRALGAENIEIARRVKKTDPHGKEIGARIKAQPGAKRTTRIDSDDDVNDAGNGEYETKGEKKAGRDHLLGAIARKLGKTADDWRRNHGGILFIDSKTELHGRKIPMLTKAVLAGALKDKQQDHRRPLTKLQLFSNCLWEIDSATRRMRQLDSGLARWQPMYRPNMTKEFHKVLANLNELSKKAGETRLRLPIGTQEELAALHPNLFGDGNTIPGAGSSQHQRSRRPGASGHKRSFIRPPYGHAPKILPDGPVLQPPMNPSDSSDDGFWTLQWTPQNQQEWNAIPQQRGDHSAWPLSQHFNWDGQPQAFYHPLPPPSGIHWKRPNVNVMENEEALPLEAFIDPALL